MIIQIIWKLYNIIIFWSVSPWRRNSRLETHEWRRTLGNRGVRLAWRAVQVVTFTPVGGARSSSCATGEDPQVRYQSELINKERRTSVLRDKAYRVIP